ncbi:MAG: DNA repair protein RecO [Gammaproteobacteria bacterium]
MSQQHDQAYILHASKFSDSRLILKLLSEQNGLIAGVARRVRSRAHGALIFQPGSRISFSFRPREGLKSLSGIEEFPAGFAPGDARLCLYFSELIVRLVPEGGHLEGLYEMFDQFMHALRSDENRRRLRMRFELSLLVLLGFVLDDSMLPEDNVSPGQRFDFSAHGELLPVSAPEGLPLSVLRRLAVLELADTQEWHTARVFIDRLLDRLLHNRVLVSRRLLKE